MLKTVLDRVLIEIEPLPEKMGLIYLPGSRDERDRVGRVVAIGEKVTQVKVGERVLYNLYSELLERDGKKYRVVKEENIFAVLDDEQITVLPKEDISSTVWEREK